MKTLIKSFLIIIFTSSTSLFAQLPDNISELVDQSAPAVVNITAKKEISQRSSFGYGGIPDEMLERFGIPRDFREMPQQRRESVSFGSGFILKSNYILTNFHVVEDATEVVVSLSDRREYKAEVVGVDPLSDLAVLQVDGKDLPYVNVGNSDKLNVGDWVIAIGSPFSFDFSVTAGIVSAKGRSIQNNNIGNYVPFLQTDVAINPGNSGGPLFNLDGDVVGINSQIYSRSGGYQGLAFAIPINVALDVADQIINNGEVSRGYLGVRMSEVDSDLADALGMNKPYGALINDVEEGESADNAGLVPGDVIIEFDSKEIKFSSDLPHVVGQIKPDSLAKAKVIRDGKEITLDFVLGELPITSEQFIPAKTQQSSDPLGLKVADIDRDNPSMTNMPDGVIVSRLNPNSAASGKVNRGDVITMIQYKGQKYMVYDVDSFNQALSNFSSNNKIAIHLIRNGTRLIRSVTLN
ncbi:MAG: Do family serine endopeptidase [SAR86 cluster bacterium]|uniref:Probable periplasmic serine endoprotease DegP-like n=1 Tax=SAR86 cluster bacterium TaxID=2030880 RepID=A0A520MYE6_9GAMM|nr:MAG: Do family serine endopeptidase [SAR86 cluster bacterium]